jgi:hypothetical protein
MVYRSYGGLEELERTDLSRPVPGAGQVLVRLIASSVNPIDWKRASGKLRLVMPVSFPAVPGYDIAGEVVEAGPGVSGFTSGMLVHARIGEMKGGASAEVVGVCSGRNPALVESVGALDGRARDGKDRDRGGLIAGEACFQEASCAEKIACLRPSQEERYAKRTREPGDSTAEGALFRRSETRWAGARRQISIRWVHA